MAVRCADPAAIFNVLVTLCGVKNDPIELANFIRDYKFGLGEYDFKPTSLGFGGKVIITNTKLLCSCITNDETINRIAIDEAVNTALAALPDVPSLAATVGPMRVQ